MHDIKNGTLEATTFLNNDFNHFNTPAKLSAISKTLESSIHQKINKNIQIYRRKKAQSTKKQETGHFYIIHCLKIVLSPFFRNYANLVTVDQFLTDKLATAVCKADYKVITIPFYSTLMFDSKPCVNPQPASSICDHSADHEQPAHLQTRGLVYLFSLSD